MTKGRLETSKVRSVSNTTRKPSGKKVSTSSRKTSAGSRAAKNTPPSVTRRSKAAGAKASKAAATKASKAARKKVGKAVRPLKTTTSKTTVTSKAEKADGTNSVAQGKAAPQTKAAHKTTASSTTTASAKATAAKGLSSKQPKKLTPPRLRRPVQLGLGFDDTQDALAVLQQQNKRLILKIAQRRSVLGLLQQLSEELMQQASQRVLPYREELKTLTRDVLDLESRVLGSEKLVGRSRDRVRLAFHELLKDLPLEELEAELDAESDAADPPASESRARSPESVAQNGAHGATVEGADSERNRSEPAASTARAPNDRDEDVDEKAAPASAEPGAPRSHTAPQSEAAQPEARSADKPSGDQSAALRALFKRLVIQWHPDRVRDETQKAERTRLMKELTQAFEGGDLAKLVSLEQTLALKKEPTQVNVVTPEQRAEHLRRANAELEKQLSELQTRIEAVREDCPFTLDHRRKDPASAARDELDEFVLVNHLAVQRATQTRDFVLNFARGKMTLSEFLQGPRRSV